MSVDQFLVVASFALGVGVFALGLKGIGSRWLMLVALTSAIAVISAGSIIVLEQQRHSQHIETVSKKIVAVVGSGRRTGDEILEGLFPEDFGTVSEALAVLMKQEKVGDDVVETVDRAGVNHRVRVYFAK